MYNKNTKVFFKTDNNLFTTYCLKTGSLATEIQPNYNHSNYFHLTKGYEPSEYGLLKYATDFKLWSNEIKKHKISKKIRFDYSSRFNHMGATISFLKCFTKKLELNFQDISPTEYKWTENCNNHPFIYFDEKYTDKEVNIFTYDYSFQYPTILAKSKLQIPLREGEEIRLTKLPRTLKFGFYRVKISGNNSAFCFGKKNIYTHYDIKQAKRLKLKVELIIDDEPNAYVYEKKDLIYTSKIFKEWYKYLLNLKTEYPKNRLVKHLGSSIWGSLSKANTIHIAESELETLDLSIYDVVSIAYQKNKRYYKLVNTEKPYKTNYRLKSYIQAYSRLITSKLIQKDQKKVVRAYADSVSFLTPQNINCVGQYKVKLEDKSSGVLIFKNVSKYEKTLKEKLP